MLFSQRFTEKAERKFITLKKTMDEVIDNVNVFDFIMTKWMAKLPGFKQRFENFQQPLADVMAFIHNQIEERKIEIKEGKRVLRDDGEDFADAFLIQIKKSKNEDSFDEITLQMTLFDLWLAGQENTSATLYWSLAYLILYPEEILRVSSILPVNLLRESVEDVTVGDYVIPKGTAVTAQLSVLMSDKEHFDEPEKFNPDRFLKNGIDQYVVPFGMRKRSCLGEALARAELYLILENILLTYDLAADPSHTASMKARSDMGGARKAQPFHITVSKRT